MTRATAEAGPAPTSEKLDFQPEESSLCMHALAGYLAAGLHSRSPGSLTTPREKVIEEVGQTTEFVLLYGGLAKKFAGAIDTPDKAVELSTEEIGALGTALFYLGTSVLRRASILARDAEEEGEVAQMEERVYTLFQTLEPTATLKNVFWLKWNKEKPSDDAKDKHENEP